MAGFASDEVIAQFRFGKTDSRQHSESLHARMLFVQSFISATILGPPLSTGFTNIENSIDV
jgi:hypothetical protein